MANIIIEPPPRELCGVEIVTDFRVWLQYEAMLLDGDITNEQLWGWINDSVFRGKIPENKADVLTAVISFYLCGKRNEARNTGSGAASKRAYDINVDAPLFAAAYRQVYGVDLTTARLHWWEFRAMMDGLPEDCQLAKVISYRTVDLDKVPKEKRRFYSDMQRRYALKPLVRSSRMTLAERDAAYMAKMDARYREAVSDHG